MISNLRVSIFGGFCFDWRYRNQSHTYIFITNHKTDSYFFFVFTSPESKAVTEAKSCPVGDPLHRDQDPPAVQNIACTLPILVVFAKPLVLKPFLGFSKNLLRLGKPYDLCRYGDLDLVRHVSLARSRIARNQPVPTIWRAATLLVCSAVVLLSIRLTSFVRFVLALIASYPLIIRCVLGQRKKSRRYLILLLKQVVGA